eukprot:Hpha_TRINITY_DN6858_c0_g1::TRINITY_DN6858_c0_g1_i1::g.46229::m.46229
MPDVGNFESQGGTAHTPGGKRGAVVTFAPATLSPPRQPFVDAARSPPPLRIPSPSPASPHRRRRRWRGVRSGTEVRVRVQAPGPLADCLLETQQEPHTGALIVRAEGAKPHAHTFDRCVEAGPAEREAFFGLSHLVPLVAAGYNAAALNFGASGELFAERGPTQALGEELFATVQRFNGERRRRRKMVVSAAALEVRGEDAHDLLNGGVRVEVRVVTDREADAERPRCWVPRLAWRRLYAPRDFDDVVTAAVGGRRTEHSPLVIMVRVERQFGTIPLGHTRRADPEAVRTASAVLTLADVDTGPAPLGRKVLAALRRSAEQLGAGAQPSAELFRESMLSRVLAGTIGGDCNTVCLVSVPHTPVSERRKALRLAEAFSRVTTTVSITVPVPSCEEVVEMLRGALQHAGGSRRAEVVEMLRGALQHAGGSRRAEV